MIHNCVRSQMIYRGVSEKERNAMRYRSRIIITMVNIAAVMQQQASGVNDAFFCEKSRQGDDHIVLLYIVDILSLARDASCDSLDDLFASHSQ